MKVVHSSNAKTLPTKSNLQDCLLSVSRNELINIVEDVSIPRHFTYNTKNNRQIADYIESELKSFGYETHFQGRYSNVVALNPNLKSDGEVVAFIMGMAIGSRVHGIRGSHTGITDFLGWLEQKVGNHPDFQWWTLESFRAMYSDDKSALKDFAKFYSEFCHELPEEEDEIEITTTESKAKELSIFIQGKEKFSEIQEEIKERLFQNSNRRDFLASDYNIFKDNK